MSFAKLAVSHDTANFLSFSWLNAEGPATLDIIYPLLVQLFFLKDHLLVGYCWMAMLLGRIDTRLGGLNDAERS